MSCNQVYESHWQGKHLTIVPKQEYLPNTLVEGTLLMKQAAKQNTDVNIKFAYNKSKI
jgi:hypothetical protein